MIDLEAIFRYKVKNDAKLIDCGFKKSDKAFIKSIPIMANQFTLNVSVNDDGSVNYTVIENALNEEYTLVNVSAAMGVFVSEVRTECEKALQDIAESCFDTVLLKAEQSKRVLDYIKTTYGEEPEFLWEKFPNCAAVRKSSTGKWFAAVMTVEKSKIGLKSDSSIEIIDLKDEPANVENRVDGKRFFKGYHMNKKYWYTVCMDGSVDDSELFNLIDKSYSMV